MTLFARLRNALYEPRVKNIPADDPNLLALHVSMLKEKPMLHDTFAYFYRKMANLCDQCLQVKGQEIELGSGAGFFKEIRPQVLTSDVRYSPSFDLALDAQNIALEDGSVRCIDACTRMSSSIRMHLNGLIFKSAVRSPVPIRRSRTSCSPAIWIVLNVNMAVSLSSCTANTAPMACVTCFPADSIFASWFRIC